MRILLWLLPASVALSACNIAVSDHPMLSGEPRSTLKLKDGLWAADNPECKFNTDGPAPQWPKCAYWLAFANGKIVGAQDAKPNELPLEIVIAEGKPQIVEFPLKDEAEKEAKSYAYIALEPASLDSTGAAIDLRMWFVACGTWDNPPHEGTTSEIKHFPGMDQDCHPVSVEAIRSAAAAGPQGQDKKGRLRWIRTSAN